MWSSERRALLAALAALPLAACGFAPSLAPGGAGAGLRGQVRADTPDNPESFALVARLEERLGPPETPRYALSYDIALRSDDIAVARGSGATRANLVGRVRFSLRPLDGAEPLHTGEAEHFTGWSTTTDPLSRRVARDDARERLMRILADRIATELTATAPRWAARE